MHPFHHHHTTHLTNLKEIIMAALDDAVTAALDADGKIEAYIDSLTATKDADDAVLTAAQAEVVTLTAEVDTLKATAAAQDALAAQLQAANAALLAKIPAPVAVPAVTVDANGNPIVA